ncbi:MAG: glycerol-3-phosphate dehydrogenase/oxidase [Chloroflexi bacterium]|uniref:Glycerol-3-phosphate dehydrogenase/oxidase n=1 Tax=Candidatus Chlorohelix allophototropha TaxID=3003348 RepID=A0A8T7M235_9CHLR|nr:glycerol-3-phosphate dehydrogenase/oxidase [Chloroflexota bacterium]WJW65740.1 glycerol-3-phosphate dehydrogenase/oxidase [Chloroflexota bacterium L227-S17]
MWERGWREKALASLNSEFDILVIGGGVTGAGIFHEAAKSGVKVALVEQRDFAWGTSSRSSKLVHGGLRYLKEGKIGLTLESVRERKRLLSEVPGLIQPLGFLLPLFKGDKPGRWLTSAGLEFYELLGMNFRRHKIPSEKFKLMAPHLPTHELKAGFQYADAQTDDARLVLRLIREGVSLGGVAINYARAEELKWENEKVAGVRVADKAGSDNIIVRARVVINATGVWADRLRVLTGANARLRPLRGSHLLLPGWRAPVSQAISFRHPMDHRPVFAFPWEGVTLVGTTDLDHDHPLDAEPSILPNEVAYLLAALNFAFPALNLTAQDVISTFAGVRPVVGSGKEDPSKESRDYVIWQEKGLLTVTGGKLTTFRSTARHALQVAFAHFPNFALTPDSNPALNPISMKVPGLNDSQQATRLAGRYGSDASALVQAAKLGELELIPGTAYHWAELRWAARCEAVVHLDDLLLRRVRLGLLLPEGGVQHLARIRDICQPELGWDDSRWQQEEAAYLKLWRECYSLPDPQSIPDWREQLQHKAEEAEIKHKGVKFLEKILLVAFLGLGMWRLLRRKKVKTA